MRSSTLFLVPALALLLAGCDFEDFGPSDRYQAAFHYSWDLQPGGRLSLENVNGSIDIIGSDSDSKVDISGVKYASTQDLLDTVQIETHNSPGAIEVRTVRPSMHHGSMGARYTVRLPRNVVLERIVSTNGGIHVRGIAGQSRIETSNGSIKVEDSAALDAHTSNGSIELDSLSGDVTARTSNGRIRAENISGRIEAESTNGPITVHTKGTTDLPARLSTSNGSIELAMASAPKAGVRAETTNGSITLRLPPGAGARVDARTSGSSINSEFDVSTNSTEDRRRTRLEGTIAGGGPLLDLSTSNGSIRLLKGDGN